MIFFAGIPVLFYVLIAYNAVVFFLTNTALDTTLLSIPMLSGGILLFNVSELLLVLGIFALYIEVLKSTRTTNASIIDHVFSMLLFIIFLVEFLVVKQAATSTFFLLMLMQMLDVIAGFTISITAARRDMSVGEH